jgi:hypothetical protein
MNKFIWLPLTLITAFCYLIGCGEVQDAEGICTWHCLTDESAAPENFSGTLFLDGNVERSSIRTLKNRKRTG